LEPWIAVGDETGGWDIVDGSFGTGFLDFTGLAWVLGPLSAWERAIQMPLGSSTALAAFSRPFASRLPEDVQLPNNSTKYHVKDVWGYCRKKALSLEVSLDVPQIDPVLELLRGDAEWLLQKSGLGVLAVGGNAADAKAAGLGLSGDGLRERARAFAGLMTVAMPFLPGDASLYLLAEGRTEPAIADAVKANRFADRSDDGMRYLEPYRDFLGRLTEDLNRVAEQCHVSVSGGSVVDKFYCKGGNGLVQFISSLRGVPFLRSHAAESVSAMKGIADLAATLMRQPEGDGCRMVVPPSFSSNHWAGNFRELRHAIHG